MKGIVLRQDEVKQLQDSGAVAVWRDVNPQPFHGTKEIVHQRDDVFSVNWDMEYQGAIGSYIKCPYATPGEVRFVRETWATAATFDHQPLKTIPHGQHIWYTTGDDSKFVVGAGHWKGKARPSNHMPEWASRYTVTCTDVAVEKRGDVWAWGISLEMAQRRNY